MSKQFLPRKIFTVIINTREYDVYNIEDKKYPFGTGPETWWIYFADRLPKGASPPLNSSDWVPWDDAIERLTWELHFTQNNTSKTAASFKSTTRCEMWCNKKLIYVFNTVGGSDGLSYAVARAQALQTDLLIHDFNFLDPQTENGRKIYWYGLPATIRLAGQPWEIDIVPDYNAGLSQSAWWKEYADRHIRFQSKISDAAAQAVNIKAMQDHHRQVGYIHIGDVLDDRYIDWYRTG